MTKQPGRKPSKLVVPAWAARIAAARKAKKWNQTKLGEKIDKSQQTIGEYEGGDSEPSLSIYRELAAALDVHPAWLIFGVEPAWLIISGEESSRYASIDIPAMTHENDRLFAWAFHQAVRLFAEEGVDADFSFTLSFTRKLLSISKELPNEAEAKEAILRTIEVDRAEFRKNINEARKKFI